MQGKSIDHFYGVKVSLKPNVVGLPLLATTL